MLELYLLEKVWPANLNLPAKKNIQRKVTCASAAVWRRLSSHETVSVAKLWVKSRLAWTPWITTIWTLLEPPPPSVLVTVSTAAPWLRANWLWLSSEAPLLADVINRGPSCSTCGVERFRVIPQRWRKKRDIHIYIVCLRYLTRRVQYSTQLTPFSCYQNYQQLVVQLVETDHKHQFYLMSGDKDKTWQLGRVRRCLQIITF